MQRAPFFLLCFALLLFGCGKPSLRGSYRVGMDPTWYPLSIGDRNQRLTAFSTELLTEIGEVEHIGFTKVSVNWDDLISGLQKGKYEAVLSSMPPYLFNQKFFQFSDVYLPLGPVLVVPINSPFHTLEALSGRQIAVISGSGNDLLLEKIPGVLIREYDSVPKALNDIVTEVVDGALIDRLTAIAYCQDLYQEQLKVSTPSLTDEGLRFITLTGRPSHMVEDFNKGLKKIKSNQKYSQLLKKWGFQE